MKLSDFIQQPEDRPKEEIEKLEKSSTNIWSVVNDIFNGDGLDSDVVSLLSNPYIINRALSHHIDTLFDAQSMNEKAFLPKILQYDYLFHSTRKYRRPRTEWFKKEKNEEVQILKEYYGCSERRAREYVAVHTEEQIDNIRSKMKKGGIDEKKFKKIAR